MNEKFKLIFLLFVIFITNFSRTKCYNYQTVNENVEIFGKEIFDEMNKQQTEQIYCKFEREGSRECDCKYKNGKMELPTLGGNIYQITVSNCKSLQIKPNTFAELSIISRVRFINIEELQLTERSLRFPHNSVNLEFINTVIEQLNSHAISGNIQQIRLENTKIGQIQAFGITGIKSNISKFSITNTMINRVESQAFKKFNVDDFEILDSEFIYDLPSRSFYDIEVMGNFRIHNSNFSRIHSSAFIMEGVSSLTLSNNTFSELDGDCFQMQIRNSITMRNNNFGRSSSAAFHSIKLDNNYFSRNSVPMNFEFISNTMEMKNLPYDIYFNEKFKMIISQVNFTNTLTCDKVQELRINKFLMDYADTIYFPMSDLLENSNNKDRQFYSFSYILNHKCVQESYLIYIIIGVVILVILLLIILITLICIYMKKRARRLNIIKPEGKTYRETQIIMQIENHNLLKTDL